MSSSPLEAPFAFRLIRISLAQGELVVSRTISSVVHAAGSFLFQNSPPPHAFDVRQSATPIDLSIRPRRDNFASENILLLNAGTVQRVYCARKCNIKHTSVWS